MDIEALSACICSSALLIADSYLFIFFTRKARSSLNWLLPVLKELRKNCKNGKNENTTK